MELSRQGRVEMVRQDMRKEGKGDDRKVIRILEFGNPLCDTRQEEKD